MVALVGFIAASICAATAWAAEVQSVEPSVVNPCNESEAFVEQAIHLVRTWIGKGGRMYGEFEFNRNAISTVTPDLNKPMELRGYRGPHGVDLFRDAAFEYRNLLGRWESATVPLIAHYGPKDAGLVVPPGGRKRFVLDLDFAPMADEARTWRLLLRTSRTECFQSLPFRVRRKPVPIEGFVSDPVPKSWSEPRKFVPCQPPDASTAPCPGKQSNEVAEPERE